METQRGNGWDGAVCATDPHPDDWHPVTANRLTAANLAAARVCRGCPAHCLGCGAEFAGASEFARYCGARCERAHGRRT